MARISVALASCLLLFSCTPGAESPTVEPPTASERAIAESEQLLPDDELTAAIPPGFELDRIVRNDRLFEREGWVTVGVRLKPEDINHARAFFYVLPNEAEARELYEEQSGRFPSSSPAAGGNDATPGPFSVPGAIEPNLCALQGVGENLWICHASAGRLYLVTQSSSAERLWPKDFEPGTDRHARTLFASFAELLDDS